MMKTLQELDFGSRFTAELPADAELANYRRQVHGACYTRVSPTPVAAPRLIASSRACEELLGLGPDASRQAVEILAGNAVVAGMDPHAACYGGHQFGHWAGQLGDGRAITLGDVSGADGKRYELQLKGAGPTPYSRTADGRAVLRSSLREFVCSESMMALGVPTTRALSLVATGDGVVRDMFYDGHPRKEPGAVVCRVAPTFVRFGNFELLAARDDLTTLRALVTWVITHHYPWHLSASGVTDESVAAWFQEVATRTAEMVVGWMRVGFVHGVMNTDNMSILGLTIDYGPYGWLEVFDPDWTPNTTDAGGRRYRFGHQPQVAMWNLARLASALLPLVGDAASLEAGVRAYASTYRRAYGQMMRDKLGLAEGRDTDEDLLGDLMVTMRVVETDYTLFFQALGGISEDAVLSPEVLLTALAPVVYDGAAAQREVGAISPWFERWQARRRSEVADGLTSWGAQSARMAAANPIYVPRNYLAQEAIDAAEKGDYAVLERWMAVLSRPYTPQPGAEHFAGRRPEWARNRPGCSTLSCSS